MRTRTLAWGLRSVVLAAVMTMAAGSVADDDGTRAVALGKEGLALFRKGAIADALVRFEEAETAYHSPVFVLYAARCERALGRLLAASRRLEQVLAEELPAGAPATWRKAKRDAETELAALRPRIPTIVVEATNAVVPVTIAVDGVEREAGLTEPLAVDPGDRRVEVVDGAKRRKSVVVAVPSGAKQLLVRVPFVRRGEDVVGEGTPGPLWPGVVALGLGVVGGGIGTATGLLALREEDDVRSRCIGEGRTECLTEDEDQYNRARTLASVSTASFVVGGLLAATGGVLLVVRPGGDDAPVAVTVRPTGLSLGGRF